MSRMKLADWQAKASALGINPINPDTGKRRTIAELRGLIEEARPADRSGPRLSDLLESIDPAELGRQVVQAVCIADEVIDAGGSPHAVATAVADFVDESLTLPPGLEALDWPLSYAIARGVSTLARRARR